MPQTTARQYGEMMRKAGILWPAPAIGVADVMQHDVNIYSIGRRALGSVFVLARRSWGTVYVSPAYQGYRDAFDAVMPRTSLGRDVDHLFPKGSADATDFIALGRISIASNRGWNDGADAQAMSQKIRDMRTNNPHSFMSQLTDLERGWAAVTCYIRPMTELQQSSLRPVARGDLQTAFG